MLYSTFVIENQLYALELGYVQEYAEVLPYTCLPKPHGSTVGIANLRGQIVSVLDLKHRLLDKFSKHPQPQYVVVRGADSIPSVKIDFDKEQTSKEPVALKVDDRGGVLEIKKDALKPSSGHGDSRYKEYVKSMVELDDKILLVLNVTRILGCQNPTEAEAEA